MLALRRRCSADLQSVRVCEVGDNRKERGGWEFCVLVSNLKEGSGGKGGREGAGGGGGGD